MASYLIQVFAFSYRNYIFAKRNIFFLAEMLFWPVMGILSVGLMGSFLKLEENTLAFVLTGAIAAGVLQVTQLDVGYSLLYDVWSKSVKHTFLSPIHMSSAILGAWLTGMVRGSIIFIALTLMARIFFGFHLPTLAPSVLFLFGIFWMSLISGMGVWILVLLYGQRAEVAVWAASYLIMVLCGLYYPVGIFPEPFLTLAKLIPLTYFLDGIRGFYGFTPMFAHAFKTGAAFCVIYTVGGMFLVQAALNHSRKNGQLLRLSE